jgi:pyruvate kinase
MRSLIAELVDLRRSMRSLESLSVPLLAGVHPAFDVSARNLVHYLAMRGHDVRDLQPRLAALGLSSLGRAESHVLSTIDAVIRALRLMSGQGDATPSDPAEVDFGQGRALLDEHTIALLGPEPAGRSVRIMVTMPGGAADDPRLIHQLVDAGMDCMRINCAHDDEAAWGRMITHLRTAERALDKACRISMDLAGPKIRTGPIESGEAVLKISPTHDPYGGIKAPARVWLTPVEAPVAPPTPADAIIPLAGEWLGRLALNERVMFTDASGASRHLTIVHLGDTGVWSECLKTAFVVPGTTFRAEREWAGSAAVRELEPSPGRIPLAADDLLIVRRDAEPGMAAVRDSAGRVLTPASIGCTLPEAFEHVKAGESIWFDDGRIGGVVERVFPSHLEIRIRQVKAGGDRLLADKGINLPDSRITIPALTDKDRQDLAFAARHADMVALSFAQEAADVDALRRELVAQAAGPAPGIVLKIETRRGFENLPAMLLAAMKGPCAGVMIARGDLAVECGFERLAEIQEEILWISEAAHVPVIWATQVLESLAKSGFPSRAEITDAAMGNRAECVMLNKGPHVVQAVQVLADILGRMAAHQSKKSPMLRELHIAQAFETGLVRVSKA